jgi:hypothetical protein
LRMFGLSRDSAVSAYRQFLNCDGAVEWSPDRISLQPVLASATINGAAQAVQIPKRAGLTLEELIAEACRRFEVVPERLHSPIRDPYVSKVRAWIAHQAVTRHVCSLSAVARTLKRNESTLREAMRAHPREIE